MASVRDSLDFVSTKQSYHLLLFLATGHCLDYCLQVPFEKVSLFQVSLRRWLLLEGIRSGRWIPRVTPVVMGRDISFVYTLTITTV